MFAHASLSLALFLSAFTLVACGHSPQATKNTTAQLHRFTSGQDGFDTHSFYFDTGKEVVVVDAQFTPQLAKKLVAEIRQRTSSPITYVVVTHPNPDKFNGAKVFQQLGAKVVASRKTAEALPDVHAYKKYYFVNIAKMFSEQDYPQLPTVDVTFEGRFQLPLASGAVVRLHELKQGGVSSTQTVVEIPAANALVVGDLVHHEAHAWLEGGIVNGKPAPDLVAWKQSLDDLSSFGELRVYGGRGKPAPVATAVSQQKVYLERVEQLVKTYVRQLGDRQGELSGDKAGEHHKAIAKQVAAAFPGYALPYMVEYGVYGLVNKVAASL